MEHSRPRRSEAKRACRPSENKMVGVNRGSSIVVLLMAVLLAMLAGSGVDAKNKCLEDTLNYSVYGRNSCKTKWHAGLNRYVKNCYALDDSGRRSIVYGVPFGGQTAGNSCKCCEKVIAGPNGREKPVCMRAC